MLTSCKHLYFESLYVHYYFHVEIVSELLSIDSVALDMDANIREDIEVNSISDATISDSVTSNQSAKNVTFNQSAEITQEKHIDQAVFKCKAANTPAVAKSRMPVTSRARFLRKGQLYGTMSMMKIFSLLNTYILSFFLYMKV